MNPNRLSPGSTQPPAMETIETNLCTLSRHVLHDQTKHKEAKGDLTLLLISIQLGCKFVSSLVRKAGLANLTGLAGAVNVQGEDVKKLDVLANDVFINSLTSSGKVCAMVSEENEEIIQIPDVKMRGRYIVVFDPLDGSSNIDAGVPVGTIFGVYSVSEETMMLPEIPIDAILRPGSEMIAAGYAMYGSFTTLVLSTGNGVNGYTLDPSLGEFILTNPNMNVPEKGKIYSVNEANQSLWEDGVRKYFDDLKKPNEQGKLAYSSRYIGSMVADVHRTLLYGGLFAYPADKVSKKGKLRLFYECFPMSFLMEKAGGLAVSTKDRVLDIVPSGIHDRAPIVLGSRQNVLDYLSYLQ